MCSNRKIGTASHGCADVFSVWSQIPQHSAFFFVLISFPSLFFSLIFWPLGISCGLYLTTVNFSGHTYSWGSFVHSRFARINRADNIIGVSTIADNWIVDLCGYPNSGKKIIYPHLDG